MASVFTIKGIRVVASECITCGVLYTVPETMWDKQQKSGGHHCCPNGHRQGWDKDGCENARLRRRAERAEQEKARLADELASSERKLKRAKKRSAAGTCPCCKRTFANMAQHMKTKHPEFVKDTGTNVAPMKKRKRARA